MRAITPSELSAGDLSGVDVWVASHTELTDDDRHAARVVLDADERARLLALAFARDRDDYLIAHAMRRRALSHYEEIAPPAWRFAASPRGRPRVVGPLTRAPLTCSLSHTAGLSICAITRAPAVGADVEDAGRAIELDLVIEHALAPTEQRALRACPDRERQGRFYRLWVLKEAYAKARGLGLSLSPDQYGFALAGDQIHLSCAPGVDPDPTAWRFAELDLGGNHRGAIAVRGLEHGAPIRVVEFERSDPRTSR